jgi:predicted nucleic acid-binding Zn ribbon protein
MIRKTNEQSLGDVITQMIKAFRMEDKITEVRINAAWEKVMGKHIHSFTDRITFRNHELTVYLKSAPLREELSHARTRIIDSLNKEVGNNAVTDLHLR